jgi:2-dehydropantoate 2-reductase
MSMKIAVIGAGAIGAYVGVKLALAGEAVTFLARGANLEALRTRGVLLIRPDGTEQVVARVAATIDYAAAGPQDLVILAVKAHQLEAVARDVPMLLGPDTVVVPMQNGIPYWYFHKCGGQFAGRRVNAVDPHGLVSEHIPAERIVGCVVYPATELVAPGVVKLIEGDRFPVGEPDGSRSERVVRVSECFGGAGLKAPVLSDIRGEIWLKLWGNLTFNPISALTRATLVDICEDAGTRQLAVEMMTEAQDVAKRFGVTMRVPLEKRIEGAAKVGRHKTSMLQDVEAGRALEIDALLGAVVELARLADVATPHLDAVYALTRLMADVAEAERRSGPLALHAGGAA